MEKKTPLYEKHIALNGKLVPFAGYLLPVQYTGVIEEHMAVRQKAGLFDVSHMGEVIICGPDALKNINMMFTNDFTNMSAGRVRYSPMCNENGGIVDDLIVYKMAEEKYYIVINASNREKDVAFMKAYLTGDAELTDVSDSIVQLALQGPRSKEILQKLTAEENIPLKYYTFIDNCEVAGVNCLISQTGYTGESGYELYCSAAEGARLWDILLEAGKEEGLIPCGLGARDTLRLEAAMPLYGHEMNDDISPFETGLDFAIKMSKDDFIGKKAIEERGAPQISRVGLKVTGRGIIREQNGVYIGNEKIGESTSGTHCPFLNGAYAMAIINKENAALGTQVEVEVRGRRIAAKVVSLPFYKKG